MQKRILKYVSVFWKRRRFRIPTWWCHHRPPSRKFKSGRSIGEEDIVERRLEREWNGENGSKKRNMPFILKKPVRFACELIQALSWTDSFPSAHSLYSCGPISLSLLNFSLFVVYIPCLLPAISPCAYSLMHFIFSIFFSIFYLALNSSHAFCCFYFMHL